jgi:hypothetical protein
MSGVFSALVQWRGTGKSLAKLSAALPRWKTVEVLLVTGPLNKHLLSCHIEVSVMRDHLANAYRL